jgi:transposase
VLTSTATEAARQARYARRVARYERVRELYTKKLAVADIAREVGLSRQTVQRYVTLTEPPPPRRAHYWATRQLDAYQPYLLQRWNEGCRNARQLWREIAALGYTASDSTVRRFIGRLRRDSGQARRFKRASVGAIYEPTGSAAPRPLTAPQVSRLLVSKADQRQPWEVAYLARLGAADSEVAQAQELADGFMTMVRERPAGHLARWLEQVEASAIRELHRFAEGIQKDYAAVEAGLTLPWSNGQTESQVGRLKLLKRAMYGRAGFELLRRRVVYRVPDEERREPAELGMVQQGLAA